MEGSYRAVVIGGGVVGASVLYHLAKFGWRDVCLVERSVLTAGSSWHAAGGVHALNADPNMAALQAYTIDLLSEVERESGQSIGLHMTGGITVASAPARWEWLKSTYRIFQTIGIEDCHLMTPQEIKERCPIMDVANVIGGLWADREGYVDTTGTVHAYAKAAKNLGAEIVEHNRVLELVHRADGTWDVVTEKGTVQTEHVVNAAGLWAKQVGRMAGLELPLSPLEHHYFVTDTIPEVRDLDFEVPMTVDLEGFTYMRQDQEGVLVGIYELNHKHWCVDGAPWEYGMDLIEEDLDRISDELEMAFKRYPVLQEAGIKSWVNGAFTFSPDGNPLVGPIRGLRNYWLACGVMAGFLQGGGVGKTLAEWMIHGETEADAWPMDIARYGSFASNREYIKQMTGQFYSRRFVMTYPNEQLWAGRPLRTPPAYGAMTEAGAFWGNSWGLEVPIYFAPKDFSETPTLKRSNAFDIVADECKRARGTAGILDISGYSRFRVTGSGAEKWLDRVLAGRLPKEGRSRLSPMLAPSGRLRGDLTVLNWGRGEWWIMGSYYLREWHMRWFSDLAEPGVTVEDAIRQDRRFRRRRTKFPRSAFELDASRSVGRRAAVHGPSGNGSGFDSFEGCAHQRDRRTRFRNQLRSVRAPCSLQFAEGGRCRFRRVGHRVQRFAFAAAGKELRDLERRVHASLYAAGNRHGQVDRLRQRGVHREGGRIGGPPERGSESRDFGN